jgi:hypothetical protein
MPALFRTTFIYQHVFQTVGRLPNAAAPDHMHGRGVKDRGNMQHSGAADIRNEEPTRIRVILRKCIMANDAGCD